MRVCVWPSIMMMALTGGPAVRSMAARSRLLFGPGGWATRRGCSSDGSGRVRKVEVGGGGGGGRWVAVRPEPQIAPMRPPRLGRWVVLGTLGMGGLGGGGAWAAQRYLEQAEVSGGGDRSAGATWPLVALGVGVVGLGAGAGAAIGMRQFGKPLVPSAVDGMAVELTAAERAVLQREGAMLGLRAIGVATVMVGGLGALLVGALGFGLGVNSFQVPPPPPAAAMTSQPAARATCYKVIAARKEQRAESRKQREGALSSSRANAGVCQRDGWSPEGHTEPAAGARRRAGPAQKLGWDWSGPSWRGRCWGAAAAGSAGDPAAAGRPRWCATNCFPHTHTSLPSHAISLNHTHSRIQVETTCLACCHLRRAATAAAGLHMVVDRYNPAGDPPCELLVVLHDVTQVGPLMSANELFNEPF